jgi:hypothetical protein
MKYLFLLSLTFSSFSFAETCFSSGEQISGMNKICYYKCVSGTKTLNKKSYELCPITANF